MAQPPDISDTFVREVDENLRRDQMRDFFKTYGSWVIAAVVLFLAASGGFGNYQTKRLGLRARVNHNIKRAHRGR